MFRISRRAFAAAIAVSALIPSGAAAADAPKEIHLDWATYNPVSMILKQKGLLEKEFAKDGIRIVWVQSAGSNKALEFLNAGSIDFGSTAGSAALVARINGNPIKSIYVFSRPEWTALVTTKDSKIASVADLKEFWPIGRPNTWRSVAYVLARAMKNRASPMHSPAIRIRTAFMPSRM